MYLLTSLADRLDPTIGNFLAAFRDERIPVELSVAILAAAAVLLAAVFFSAASTVTRIRGLRALIRAGATRADFAANFAAIDRQFSISMFKDSWREYRKCLRPGDGTILYLRGAEEFLGLQAVDCKTFPARFFAAAHGYFIGIGLVLTFIGLVAALKFAATGVASSDLAVAKDALDALLAAAAFKFMTSIVGLGSSLALSIAARSATYAVESAALGLARDLERAMEPIFSECVAYDEFAATRAQLGQLQRIETGLTQVALQRPAAPVVNTDTQTAAMLQEVLAGFRAEMRNTAGGEMKQLAGKLSDVGGAIGAMQSHIGRSGEHFAEQIDLAATRLLAAASKLQESVDRRADAASTRLEARIESLATAFSRGEAQLAGAADKAAGALAVSASELDANLRAQLGHMRDIVTLLDRTRDALGDSASSWMQCTVPVIAATEASRQVASELGQIVGQIGAAQSDMSDMAKAVAQLSERVGVVWDNYRRRFEKVDDEMQAVFERLQGGTRAFGEEVMDFVGKLDTSLASGMQALSLGTEELRQTAQMFVLPGNAKAA
jgi:hypothetical protein